MFFECEFQYPWMFALFLPALGIILYMLLRKEPQLRFPFFGHFPHRPRRHSLIKLPPILFYAAAMSALIIALSAPRLTDKQIKQKFDGVDILLAVDLSASMEAYDPPDELKTQAEIMLAYRSKKLRQRLDICKDAILRLVQRRPNDRFGLVPFADQSFVVCPPTIDNAFVCQHIRSLRTHTFGEGTGLASPIVAILDHTRHSEAKRKIMILITDGYNTIRNKITPIQAAKIAAQKKLIIHTVGIGNNRAFRDLYGRIDPFPENYDEDLLRKISELTGGVYFSANDEAGLERTLQAIDKLEKSAGELPPIIIYKELSTLFTGLFAALALIGFILEHTLCLRQP